MYMYGPFGIWLKKTDVNLNAWRESKTIIQLVNWFRALANLQKKAFEAKLTTPNTSMYRAFAFTQ